MSKKTLKPKTNEARSNAEEEIKQHARTIDYNTAEFTLEVIHYKLKKEDFFIPHYQRKDVWDNGRKSKFIESLLIGLPIPFLFFWQNEDGRLEIVDGAQRLTTIKQFLDDELILGKLEKLSALNKFRFSDLVESRQRRFRDTSIRSIMLTDRADSFARFDLFERINTTSKVLTPAELRRGLAKGKFLEMVESLAKNKNFIAMTHMSKGMIESGEREEIISRFFAYGDGLNEYKNSIKNFVFSYTVKMNNSFKENPDLQKEYEQRFESIIDFYYEKLPNGFKTQRSAMSKTRFESLAVGAYLAFKEYPQLEQIVTKNDLETFCKSTEYLNAVKSDASNTTSKLKHRLEITKNEFLSKIEKGK